MSTGTAIPTAPTLAPAHTRTRPPRLSASELAELHAQLIALEEECERQMLAATVVLEEIRDSGSLTDPATQATLLTTLHSLDESERVAAQVSEALTRMASGRFGLCPRCLRPIPVGRLRARPFGRHCVACSR